jgi:hypothetical protein
MIEVVCLFRYFDDDDDGDDGEFRCMEDIFYVN